MAGLTGTIAFWRFRAITLVGGSRIRYRGVQRLYLFAVNHTRDSVGRVDSCSCDDHDCHHCCATTGELDRS